MSLPRSNKAEVERANPDKVVIEDLTHRVGTEVKSPSPSGKHWMLVIHEDGSRTWHHDMAHQCNEKGKALQPKSLRKFVVSKIRRPHLG